MLIGISYRNGFYNPFYDKIINFGPLSLLRTMNFKDNQKNVKEILIGSRNHKNILKSIAEGICGKFSYTISSDRLFESNFETIGKKDENDGLIRKVKIYGNVFSTGNYLFSRSTSKNTIFDKINSIRIINDKCILEVTETQFLFNKKMNRLTDMRKLELQM